MTNPPQDDLTIFMGLAFETSEDVLIPRQETETLGRAALELLTAAESETPIVIDMCCGAGNLACVLAHSGADIRVWASDLTDACVELTRRNVTRLQLDDRVQVRQGDLFEPLRDVGLEGTADLVVCNPPYISSGKLAKESAHLLDGQPREAFDAGPYGLAIHRRLIRDAPAFLRSGGWLAFEIGLGQQQQIGALLDRTTAYDELRTFSSEDGAPRAMAARHAKTRQAE